MTTGMFADLVNFLIQPFEKMITINRSNPMDGVLSLCKFYNYKGKAEKSWLRTGDYASSEIQLSRCIRKGSILNFKKWLKLV